MTGAPVRAAGGVPWRRGPAGVEVLVVHRPRYDDWSFPKGKAASRESDHAAAVREVAEETGLVPVVGQELPGTSYTDHRGRPKVVRYWAMTVPEDGAPFRPNDEVDRIEWMPCTRARSVLSYGHDVAVLDALERLVAE